QEGAHPRQQGPRAERLGQVVVGSDVESLDLILLAGAHGQHHHRHRRACPDLPADVQAGEARQVHVEDHQVGLLALEDRQGGDAVGGVHRPVAGLAQGVGDEPEEIQIVVHHQDLHAVALSSVLLATGQRGKVTRTRVPAPSRRASTVPPCRSTIDWTIHRPSPMPLCSGSSSSRRGARTKRSKSELPAPPGMPGPSSSTQRPTTSGRTSPPIRTSESAGAYFWAFARRLTKTWVSRGASPSTSGSG